MGQAQQGFDKFGKIRNKSQLNQRYRQGQF